LVILALWRLVFDDAGRLVWLFGGFRAAVDGEGDSHRAAGSFDSARKLSWVFLFLKKIPFSFFLGSTTL
jgi:hypothetical protein